MCIKIIIADDHIMMREGIKNLLEMEGKIKVVAEANDGEECLSLIDKTKADVLLLDINMPKVNGLEVLERLKKSKSKIKVLMLTVHNEVEYLIKAIDANVDGYMLKDSESAELIRAIEDINSGETYIQPCLIPLLNATLVKRDADKDKLDTLTNREVEVLIQIAKGSSNKEIAENLVISERTVKNHISSIFKKIETSDRTQAAVFAIKNNLISLF